MTIYEIKERTKETAPYFFSRSTMKFFNQTLKDFKVRKIDSTHYHISAPMKDHSGKIVGKTERIFSTLTNKLYNL